MADGTRRHRVVDLVLAAGLAGASIVGIVALSWYFVLLVAPSGWSLARAFAVPGQHPRDAAAAWYWANGAVVCTVVPIAAALEGELWPLLLVAVAPLSAVIALRQARADPKRYRD